MTRQYATSPFAETDQQPVAPGRPPRMSTVTPFLVLVSAAATTLLMVSSAIVVTLNEAAIRAWWSSDAYEPLGVMDLLVRLEGLAALTNLAAFVVTGIWLLNLRRVAEWASPSTTQRRSSYWAFLGWIVPVVNLWFPYQVVQDASRGVGSRVKNLMPWWIAWLALSFVMYLSNVGVGDADLTAWIRTVQILGVLAIVAFVLWFRVVRSATTAAAAEIDRVRVPS